MYNSFLRLVICDFIIVLASKGYLLEVLRKNFIFSEHCIEVALKSTKSVRSNMTKSSTFHVLGLEN